jgi:hypothetical protein
LGQNLSGNSGKVAVYNKKNIRINIFPVASAAEKNIKQTKKLLFHVLNYNYLKPEYCKKNHFSIPIKILSHNYEKPEK